MLIFRRKVKEAIVVGDAMLIIKVIDLKDGTVCIGIDAPEAMSINREEVYRRKKRTHRFEGKINNLPNLITKCTSCHEQIA